MNVVKKLTLRHLKENKGRTVVTTLGICVSVAMITAVFVAIASFLNFFGIAMIMSDGDYHFQVTAPREKLVEYIEKDDSVESVGYRYNLNYKESGYRIREGVSKHTSTGDWVVGDKEYLNHIITCEYDGALPSNENEIMVERDFIDKNQLDWKIGDTVKITSGHRKGPSDYLVRTVTGAYQFGERFEENSTKEYKIVGILNDNIPTKKANGIIRLAGEEEDATVSASVILKKVNVNTIKDINRIVDKFHFSENDRIFNVSINNSYLETKFAIDKSSSSLMSLIPMIIIILVIIMIVSVALIYNAFGMSYAEKVRYLGMLSSVGATARQKKKSVYFEGIVLGAVGIPVGFGAGVLGIWITLSLIGDRIVDSSMINGADNLDFNVVVPLYAVICILVISIITILISILRPAVKASAITPIDAIRQTNEIKVKKKIRTPFFIRKIFGYEGELAYKNLKRNARKSRIITVSIALSVILFLSCNYFCDMFVRANNIQDDIPYQIDFVVQTNDFEKIEKMLGENDDIKDFFCTANEWKCKSDYETDKDDDSLVIRSNINELLNEKTLTSKYKTLADSNTTFYFNFIDDDDFNELCKNNGIDSEKYYSYENVIKNPDDIDLVSIRSVVMNNISHKNGGENVFTDEFLNIDFREYGVDVETNKTIEMFNGYHFEDFVDYDNDNYVCHLNPSNTISLYAPASMFYNLYEGYGYNGDGEYQRYYGIVTDEHKKLCEELENFIEQNDYGDGCSVNDIVESKQIVNTVIFVMQVFIYGFIALTTLITLFNIINTISTGIALRKKEFAMLKSVGTTPKGFNKMIMLESAFYGIRALVFGIPISIAVSYLMNYKLANDRMPFEINYPMYIAVIAVVFIIIGATMLYSVHKLKNDSIVETLKEEIN